MNTNVKAYKLPLCILWYYAYCSSLDLGKGVYAVTDTEKVLKASTCNRTFQTSKHIVLYCV